MNEEILADLSDEERARVRELASKVGLTVEEMLKLHPEPRTPPRICLPEACAGGFLP